MATLKIELQILDARLPDWGFPHWGSPLSAGLDLHACIDAPLKLEPQAPAVLVPAGIAFRIGDPEWCALVLPRSGLGHNVGLVLGNGTGLIDADYEGPLLVSAWNRSPLRGRAIAIRPGDRIAQLVFVRTTRPKFVTVSEFSQTGSRQAGGFGSTGIAGRPQPAGVAPTCRRRTSRRHC